MREKTREYLNSLLPQDSEYKRVQPLLEYKQDAKEHLYPVIHDDTLQLIRVMIKTSEAKKMLEVGTAVGASAMLFSSFMGEDSKIITIERDPDSHAKAVENISSYGYSDRITPLLGEAEPIVSEMTETMAGTFDIVFLDGAKGHYIYLLDDCVKLLRPGGLLIADNVLFRGMVSGADKLIRRKITIVKRLRKFLIAINNREDIISSVLPIGDGVSVSVKIK
jgi:predicted O-methyltransferase YrrM